ncbi:major facilitator superfamily domain-containing protein [Lasiosphaeria miniovina]|uniref:Major facilitator superfamily domain-containing protein n=1 Tax=Lasiosphaeria miniovina TaxID=1954250 RepID=A0AA40B3M8_9PEZI|nr:major facilitator superfamily domain-containing protein [Lasiosphaeria miniovina]KAK0726902.1 major facilitator superfamily domain-containing protein [Lasiosphaeria miniovina]
MGWKFWMVFPPLCVATLLIALESTVTSTALPEIAAALNSGDNYVWFLNGYLLTATIFLPLYGQFADVFGRRWPTIFGVAVFTLGSGISGGAHSTGAMIAGRLVQGLGAAGITSMTQIIVGDLVPARERPKHMGVVFAVFGVGTTLGPPVGGVIVAHDWRWVFWLNLPVGAVTLVMQFLFLKVAYVRRATFRERMRSIDWLGNLLLGASVVAVLTALSWADVRYPWSSWRVIVPLVVGFAGFLGFHVYEMSPWCAPVPAIAPYMWASRASAVGLVLSFLQSMLIYWRTYFLPLYFQAVLLASPARSGALLLPTILMGIPAAIIGGGWLSRSGRYKPIHFFGFASTALATGLYIDFGRGSSLAKVVLYQIVCGLGGVLLSAMVPAIQAAHPQSRVAAATSTWNFYRSFGAIWGITIPAAVFNSRMAAEVQARVSDPRVRALIGSGDAYARVSSAFISSLPEPVQSQVVDAYRETLRLVWIVCLAFSVLALLLVFAEPEIPLKETLVSDYQLEEAEAK